jgi:uncharacterized protein (DUF2062 family)
MLKAGFTRLLNLDDPPERTALAFAIGTAIAFSPLLGLHTILAALIAIVWRLNKVAIFSGSYLNNPWTVAPIVAFSWAIGRLIIGSPPIDLPEITAGAITTAAFWQSIAAAWRQLLPFAVGASILSITTSLISYPVMLHFLRLYRRRNADGRSNPPATVVTRSVTERN